MELLHLFCVTKRSGETGRVPPVLVCLPPLFAIPSLLLLPPMLWMKAGGSLLVYCAVFVSLLDKTALGWCIHTPKLTNRRRIA